MSHIYNDHRSAQDGEGALKDVDAHIFSIKYLGDTFGQCEIGRYLQESME